LSGRGPDNRLVHFSPGLVTGAGAPSSTNEEIRPGDMVTVEITRAAPHHLVADGGVLAVRRTRSGDAWEARTSAPAAPVVGLGMPAVGQPA
jgi:tRNA-2-methylthio-N6-dimethylallyladenosine synthase